MARESSRQDAGGCGGLLKDGCVVVPRTDDDRAEEEDAVEWKEVEGSGAIPIGRIGHSICYDGRGDLYLWGGVNDTVEGKYLADFFRYVCFDRFFRPIRLLRAPHIHTPHLHSKRHTQVQL